MDSKIHTFNSYEHLTSRSGVFTAPKMKTCSQLIRYAVAHVTEFFSLFWSILPDPNYGEKKACHRRTLFYTVQDEEVCIVSLADSLYQIWNSLSPSQVLDLGNENFWTPCINSINTNAFLNNKSVKLTVAWYVVTEVNSVSWWHRK